MSRRTTGGVIKEALSFAERGRSPGSRVLVLLADEPGGELVVRGGRGDFTNLSPACSAVLQAAQASGRALLVSDREDRLLASLPSSDIGSALCVPIQNAEQGLVGWLYADDSAAGAFTVSDRVQWESYGRELGRSLRQAEPVAPVSQRARSTSPPPAALIAAVGLGLLLLMGWGLARRPGPVSVDQPTPRAVAEDEAVDVARSFHQLLRLRELHQAWMLLTPRLQEKLPEDAFKQKVSAWLADETNRWEIQSRKISPLETRSNQMKVRVEPGPDIRQATAWTWTLIPTEGGWRLDRLEGPVSTGSGYSER
ncbi:MAG: hypothetical protein AB7S38_36590 [Vulcanimicrobiota bacterium]